MSGTNTVWIGHRGFPARFPENTVPSLVGALEQGAAGVEFDIQVSRDGVPVVLHDEDLLRTAGINRRAAELDVAELLATSVHEPLRFGDRFLETPIATLARVVDELARYPAAYVFAEIKHEVFSTTSREQFAEAVATELKRLPKAVIISFDLPVLRICQQRFSLPVGWVLRRYDEQSLSEVRRQPVDFLICNHEKFPPLPTPLWSGPWQWFAYDIINSRDHADCRARGVPIMETWDVASMLAQHSQRA